MHINHNSRAIGAPNGPRAYRRDTTIVVLSGTRRALRQHAGETWVRGKRPILAENRKKRMGTFILIPSHSAIPGNEHADSLGAAALAHDQG